ncbi:MAG: ABC transporter substrate-binding protein [Acidimicrobiaceae bacterium]|nr:ABC transporter substrate-binding protein [Acidimicrobiaceae bacterium]MCY3891854.1 ABC transporter substrate-binding protein [Acidimicrobiaceae bacterium]
MRTTTTRYRQRSFGRLLVALLAVLALVAASCASDDDDDAAPATTAAAASGADADDDMDDGDDHEHDEDDGHDHDEDGDDAGSDDMADDSDMADDDMVMDYCNGGANVGGTLIIGSTQVPRHLNGTVQSGYATAVPGTQLNASPLLYDDEYNPMPYLAESWDVADDGLSVTLHLVEDAVFHDGMPITSADVAFSIQTVQANHPFKPMYAPVTSVDTPDEHTAVINLSQPHPAILLAMSPGLLPIIPKHIFDDGQDMKSHPRNSEDFVGSGPFRLAEYEPGTIIRMERFDDFFIEGTPCLDEIVMEITPDSTAIVLSLENGTTHLSSTLGPAANVLRLMDNPDVEVTAQGHEAIGQINWLEFNLNDPALSDVRVRQAIGYAIDRDFLSGVIEQGLTFPVPTGIAAASPFHNADVNHYDKDIDRAKQLLAEAGYGEGELELTIDYIPPAFVVHAEYVVQALQEAGINVELSVSPDFPTWAQRVAGGDYQMTINQVWNWGDPVIGVHRTYLCDNRVGVIWTNNTGYCNPEVDALLAAAGQELDAGERTRLYAEFQEIVAEDVPIYFLNTPSFWQAFNPAVMNPPTNNIWGQMSPMHQVWLDQ